MASFAESGKKFDTPYIHTVPPPDIGNRVAVKDRVRTAIAVAVHNSKIVVFCYVQRGFSGEETNRVQTTVCLFSPRFSLCLNFYYSYSTVYVHAKFYKTFPNHFQLFLAFNPKKPAYLNLVKSRII